MKRASGVRVKVVNEVVPEYRIYVTHLIVKNERDRSIYPWKSVPQPGDSIKIKVSDFRR